MITIPPEIFTAFNEVVDDIWSRSVTLVYPEIREECPNCYFNGNMSVGVYKPGGPYPFDEGSPCPYCFGEGVKLTQNSSIIMGRIYYNRQDWVKIGIPISIPDMSAMLTIKMTDLPAVQKCSHIIPSYYDNINVYQNQPLYLIGQYSPQGFSQNPVSYVNTFWRTNGQP